MTPPTHGSGTPSTADGHRDALLAIHRALFPERYPRELNPDHAYWEEDPPAEVYEWDSGTIEWVAQDIERALAGDPDLR